MVKRIALILGLLLLTGCTLQDKKEIYNGRVEATEIRLSAQTPGQITRLNAQEGDIVKAGQTLAVINKEKLAAQYDQISADLIYTKDLLKKTKKLLASGAATRQRRDELATKVKVLSAQEKTLKLQLADATITAPLNGTVLTIYNHRGEYVGPGSPILDLADLSEMNVRIYVPLSELPKVKIGQKATINVDGLKSKLEGNVVWISSEAEFTPKTILTKETRTTLVYAVKIKIPNPDGILKIGMPVDVDL